MEDKGILQIDVETMIANKNLRLLKRLPRFIINYLERIIHQDEINEYLKEHGAKKDLEFVDAAIEFLGVKKKIYGFDNIPAQGRFVFAANHPLGGLESLVFMQEIAKLHPELKIPVNDILMNLKNLKGILVPISKFGNQSREIVKNLDEVFNSQVQILYFPAGLCSRKIKGEIKDLQWQKTFVTKAKKSGRDIIPVYIYGKNSNFFYRLSNFRRIFGIKANIEMLYLVDEMFKQKGATIKFVFGKPFPNSKIDNSKTDSQWAEHFRNITYSLKEKLSENE